MESWRKFEYGDVSMGVGIVSKIGFAMQKTLGDESETGVNWAAGLKGRLLKNKI